jgi:ribonuclease T1
VFWTGLASSSHVLGRALHKKGMAAVFAAGLVAGAMLSTPGLAKSPDNPAGQANVVLATLPTQAQTTYQLILNGGPFPYSKDGVVFGNRERSLPSQARGYYREYTVKTPGARNRGARRIVCGGKAPTQPEACFYTDDHYASFRRIVK